MKLPQLKKKLLTGVGAVALTVMGSGANAAFLTDLFAGGTITVLDKEFSDWILIDSLAEDGVSPLDISNIEVEGIPDDPLNPGLEFDAAGDLEVGAATDVLTPASLFLEFGFKVTVTDPDKRIKDNELNIVDGFQINSGDYLLFIQETVCSTAACLGSASNIPVADEIAFKQVDDFVDTDIQTFPGRQEIWVNKFVSITNFDTGVDSSVEITQFQQFFSQEEIPPEPTPAPGTIALAALGLLGLGYRRRRAALQS